jgi:sarcosine oxidase
MAPTAVIIGAGINGLCVADALLQKRWRVTVADRGSIPNPLAASYDHHRVIRAHYPDEPTFCRRAEAALQAWEALWDRIGVRRYHQTGILALCSSAGDWTDRCRRVFDQCDVQYRQLSPSELCRDYPFLNVADLNYGLLTESGGVLMAADILADLTRSLRRRGATLIENFDADTISVSSARARAKGGQTLQGDILVVAAGTGISALLDDIIPERFTPMRTIVLYVDHPRSWNPGICDFPSWVSLGNDDALWGVPPIAGIPMKFGCGLKTRPGDPATERHVSEDEASDVLALYRDRFADLNAARVVGRVANFWTMAPEGRFVLRQVERCYVVSACSGHGFKFAVLTGQDAAEAIAAGDRESASRRLAG